MPSRLELITLLHFLSVSLDLFLYTLTPINMLIMLLHRRRSLQNQQMGSHSIRWLYTLGNSGKLRQTGNNGSDRLHSVTSARRWWWRAVKREASETLNTQSIFNLQNTIYRKHVCDLYLAAIVPEGSWQPKAGRLSYLCQYLTKGVLANAICL